jgi:hypothetical protein
MLECSYAVCAFRTMAHIRILYRSRLKMMLERGGNVTDEAAKYTHAPTLAIMREHDSGL